MLKKDKKELDKLLQTRDPKEDGLKNHILWKRKYHENLLDYNYIHTLDEFVSLTVGGLIKPIYIYDEQLKAGGIIIKIEKEEPNKWYCLVGIFDSYNKIKYNKKFWKIYFDKNYIYYKPPNKISINDDKTELYKNYMDKFISKNELTNFKQENKTNELVDNLFNYYVKKNEV